MKYILFLILNFLLLSNSYANLWKINKDHSEINFEIPYMGVSTVTGKFLNFKGSLNIEDENLEDLKIEILTSSIFTANKMRDQHLKEPDFLNVEKFEAITFKSLSTSPKGPSEFEVKGLLNFNGVEKEIILPLKVTDLKKDTWGYDSRFVSFKFQINRSDYNLSWNKTMAQNELLIGKLVNIQGVIQIQPAGAMTPFAKHKIPDTKAIRLAQKLKRGEITQAEYEKSVGMDKTFDEPSQIYKKVPKHNKEVMNSKVPENEDQKYQEFSKESLIYYLSSMLVAFFGMLGIYYFYLYMNEKEEQGKLTKKTSKLIFLIVFTVYLWSAYIVSFDDFMAFSIQLLKMI